MVEGDRIDDSRVAVVVCDEIDDSIVRVVRGLRARTGRVRARRHSPRRQWADGRVGAGVAGVLRRAEATPESLSSAVVAATKGDGTLAPDLIGRLLHQMNRLQHDVLTPRGLGADGLSDRERSVLKLLSEGLGTHEIAGKLAYSERTIKNVIHDVTTRLNLRNRSHAVAYAVKAGIV